MSVPFSFDEIQQVAKLVLVANTPGFLFKRLVSHPLIQRLARECSSQQLLKLAQTEVFPGGAHDIRDLVAYVIVGALAIKGDNSSIATLRALQNSKIRWLDSLIAAGIARQVTDTVTTLELRSRIHSDFMPTYAAETNSTVANSIKYKSLITVSQ